jgi:rSAM/selenodomain-associated transferase 2
VTVPADGSQPSHASGPLVSVVVPALDEAAQLPGLLDHLAGLPGRLEMIVCDGGSSDDTVGVAERHPRRPRVVRAPRGRAAQLNAGAAQATGEVLLFLHADTRLPAGAWCLLAGATADPEVGGGNFDLRFDAEDRFAVLLAWFRRRERRLGVYYGDSAIFCRREVFDRLGGYRPLEIMEDYDFARRLEQRTRTVCLPGPAVTSARRWQRRGVLRTVLTWNVIRWLFLAGVPARWLARLYAHVR